MINDIKKQSILHYEDFLGLLEKPGSVSNVIVYDDFVSFYLNLLRSLKMFDEVFILDSLADISADISTSKKTVPFVLTGKKDFSDLLQKEVVLNLLTSGTTGKPKVVKQKLSNILRFVKIKSKFQKSNWLFCYNPSHIAGLQVFFQAFLNSSSITFAFDAPAYDIGKILEDGGITNISFTPTFFSLLLPYLKEDSYPSIETVAFGGERLPEKNLSLAKKLFPRAKIRNLYASTEFGTILSSDEQGFQILPELTSKVKIENNELFVHRDLMGKVEGFADEWFPTGDMVEFVNGSTFIFISRKSEVINVGGYNVNPGEIEETISQLPFVKAVKVYGRKNSMLGNLVCADLVLNPTEESEDKDQIKRKIISYCAEKLVDWKVPRKISFVTELGLTKTGKVQLNG